MLYAAPPRGANHPQDADFLSAIRDTATNIVTCLGRYNAIAPKHGVPSIEVLRLCLFSSNIYNDYAVPLDEIALAIFDGVAAGAAVGATGLKEVQFPYAGAGDDGDGPLFAAVKAKYGA